MASLSQPQIGVSLMLEPDFLAAALPLFEDGVVDVLEWSFDMGWGPRPLPEWASSLLAEYSDAGNLLGHGVTFSPLSGHWAKRQDDWLRCLGEDLQVRKYRHISEHFGFMSAGNFHQSAPLPVPLSPETLAIGSDRLQRLRETAQVPVGLENLAFAFSPKDVMEQGEFLEKLLAPVDGFLVLDLHNVYCQLCNFDVDADTLLGGYPLERVREMHVAGGSWSESPAAPGERIRRDTHDSAVPEDVFGLVEQALARCPNVDAVIFERLGNTLHDAAEVDQFRSDFHRLRSAVAAGSGEQ